MSINIENITSIPKSQLMNMHKNIINMFNDRKYKIINLYKKVMIDNIEIEVNDNMGKKIIAILRAENTNLIKMHQKKILSYISTKKKKITHVIIFSNLSNNKKHILKKEGKYFVEFINLSIILLDLPRHKFQPKFEVLTKSQIAGFLNNSIASTKEAILDINDSDDDFYKMSCINGINLPKMLNIDPIAIWYGVRPGQIFKILSNPSKFPGRESISYRIVIDSIISLYSKK